MLLVDRFRLVEEGCHGSLFLGRLPHKAGNDGCEHNRYEDGKKETRGCVGGWLRVVRVMLMHLGFFTESGPKYFFAKIHQK